MLGARSRSGAAILIAALGVSCVYSRASISSSTTRAPNEDTQCFEACNNEIDCVARCPGAVSSAQACDGEELCTDEKSLAPGAKIALTVGIVVVGVAAAGLLAFAVYAAGQR